MCCDLVSQQTVKRKLTWKRTAVFQISDNQIVIYYFGKVTDLGEKDDLTSFLRKQNTDFVFPDVPDKSVVSIKNITLLSLPQVKRGIHTFKKLFHRTIC